MLYINEAVLTPISNKFGQTKAKEVIGHVNIGIATLDEIFFFLTFGLGLVTVLLAFVTPARPAFLFLAVILFSIALIIIPSFANIFQDISEKSQFSTYTTEVPMMMYIFEYYPYIFWGFGFLIIIVLFAKLRGQRDVI